MHALHIFIHLFLFDFFRIDILNFHSLFIRVLIVTKEKKSNFFDCIESPAFSSFPHCHYHHSYTLVKVFNNSAATRCKEATWPKCNIQERSEQNSREATAILKIFARTTQNTRNTYTCTPNTNTQPLELVASELAPLSLQFFPNFLFVIIFISFSMN